MSPKKDFSGAMNRLTSREVVLGGDRNKTTAAVQPFGESLREQLEKEASAAPIREVAIARLADNPFQKLARPSYDDRAMAELVSSIRQNGFYGALLARRRRGSEEQYELAFGHRRKEAARQAGIDALPVKILDLTDTQMARIMASENFAREDLTPLGEANVIGHLNVDQNLSAADISKIVGKGEGWIKLRLALYHAPTDIKEMVRQKPETLGHIRLLLQTGDAGRRAALIGEILTTSLTREQLQTRLVDPTPSVTNITSSIQYTDSEKDNNIENQGLDRSDEKISLPGMTQRVAGKTKSYKKSILKLTQSISELEKLNVSEKGRGSITGEERVELKALSERLARLCRNW